MEASRHPRDQLLACWLSAGTRAFRSNVLPAGLSGNPKRIGVQLIQHGSPIILHYIAERAAVRLRDPMSFAVVPLWRHLANRPDFKVEERSLESSPDIEGFAAESLDMHCRPGKRALKQFGTTCEPVRKFLVDHCMISAETALSFAVFIAEGGLSATTVQDPTLDHWKAIARDAELRFAGVASAQQFDLLQVVTENLNELNHCRANAICRLSSRGP